MYELESVPSTERWTALRGTPSVWFGFCYRWLAVWLTVVPASGVVAQKPPEGAASQPVVAAEIVKRHLSIEQTFVGTVVPKRVSQVGSPVEGRVIELFVEEGDRVGQGAKLAQLRTESLEIELASAEAELELLEHELERLKVAGPKEIEQAEARMLAAEALKDFTKSRLDRGERLSAGHAMSDEELAEIVSAATGALKVHEERTTAWELAVATLPIDIAKAQSKIQVQKETIRLLKDDIAEHTILAPFDGYVSQEHTEVGQWIAKGGLVVEVVELGEVDVRLPVLETYVSQLRVRTKDQPGTKTRRVEIGALPGVEFQGEVVSIVPKANLSSRTFPVNVRLTNRLGPNGVLLKPGMFARVTLPVTEIPDAMLVPKDALVLGEGPTVVWMIREEADFQQSGLGQAVPVPVATGAPHEGWIQVRPLVPDRQDLLQPGQRVIVEGNERVNPKLPVRVLKTLRYDEQGPKRGGARD